jgi:hypothetical protein
MDTSINRHVLRLAGGITLPFVVGEALGWRIPFVASIFALQLLAVAKPPPTLRAGVVSVAALGAAFFASVVLTAIVLPFPLLFVAGVGAAVFGGLYGQARNGSPFWFILLFAVTATPILAGQSGTLATTFATIAVRAMIVAVATVWLMHAAFPHPAQAAPSSAPPATDSRAAARKALLGTLVVMPLVLWLLANESYAVVAVVTTLTILQVSSAQDRGRVALGLLAANVVAGAIAIAAYGAISVAPTLTVLAAVMVAVSLTFGGSIAMGGARVPLAIVACSAVLVLLGMGFTAFNDPATAFLKRVATVLLASGYTVGGLMLLERLTPRATATPAAH